MMAKVPNLVVKITADTRGLRREFLRGEILLERSAWRRLRLRVALWKIRLERRRDG